MPCHFSTLVSLCCRADSFYMAAGYSPTGGVRSVMPLEQSMSIQRKLTIGALAALLTVVCVAMALPRLTLYQLTGFPIRKVDTLRSPIAVSGWTTQGLLLADGRTVQLPGFHTLPSESVALTEASKRGVEIATDGRVYGLVQVIHGCGNDPVREHIARVDVADLLMYLREGEWTTPPSAEALELAARERGGTLKNGGWEVSEFMMFQHWKP